MWYPCQSRRRRLAALFVATQTIQTEVTTCAHVKRRGIDAIRCHITAWVTAGGTRQLEVPDSWSYLFFRKNNRSVRRPSTSESWNDDAATRPQPRAGVDDETSVLVLVPCAANFSCLEHTHSGPTSLIPLEHKTRSFPRALRTVDFESFLVLCLLDLLRIYARATSTTLSRQGAAPDNLDDLLQIGGTSTPEKSPRRLHPKSKQKPINK